jgi:hypothetical protein
MSLTVGLELVLGLGGALEALTAFTPEFPRPASEMITTTSAMMTSTKNTPPPTKTLVARGRVTARVSELAAMTTQYESYL